MAFLSQDAWKLLPVYQQNCCTSHNVLSHQKRCFNKKRAYYDSLLAVLDRSAPGFPTRHLRPVPQPAKPRSPNVLSRLFAPHVQNILHGDDFCTYIHIHLLPIYNGYPDTDGPGGGDFEKMVETFELCESQRGGKLPGNSSSWQADVFQDQKEKALQMISQDIMTQVRNKVSEQIKGAQYSIVIMEWFLLHHRSGFAGYARRSTVFEIESSESEPPEVGAKEGGFRKTEDYFEKMVCWNYAEQ